MPSTATSGARSRRSPRLPHPPELREPGLQLSDGPGYGQVRRDPIGGRAKYNVTRTSCCGRHHGADAAEDVDTHGVSDAPPPGIRLRLRLKAPRNSRAVNGGAGSCRRVWAAIEGSDNYLGTEINLGFEWHFAPNIALLWLYGHRSRRPEHADSHRAPTLREHSP